MRSLRDRLGVSRAQFAAVFGVTRSTVARWESAGAQRARRDVVAWMATLAAMPPAVFEPVRMRIERTFAAGPWPAGWTVATVVNVR